MSGLFKKIIASALESTKEQRVALPVTEAMLQRLLQKKQISGVEQIDIRVADEMIFVKGKVKKMLLQVPFEISLKPQKAEGRLLHFEITKFSPTDLEMLKKKVFNQPPFVSYQRGIVSFDLNGLEIVKKVPIGHIKSIEIKDNKLWVQLGV